MHHLRVYTPYIILTILHIFGRYYVRSYLLPTCSISPIRESRGGLFAYQLLPRFLPPLDHMIGVYETSGPVPQSSSPRLSFIRATDLSLISLTMFFTSPPPNSQWQGYTCDPATKGKTTRAAGYVPRAWVRVGRTTARCPSNGE